MSQSDNRRHLRYEIYPQCSHKSKGSLVQRELARERLRDCKGLDFAEQKRKR